MTDTTFSLHFRGWKDKHHIKAIKYELVDERNFKGYAYYIYDVSFKKDGIKHEFQYGDSHNNWKKGNQNLNEQDLYFAIMYELQEAESVINEPNFKDYMASFGYEDCCQGYKCFKYAKKAREELLKLFGTEDNIMNAVEELRRIEDIL